MVAHGRPEDDEVRKSGGGWKDQPAIRRPSEDMLRHVYVITCGLDFEMTTMGSKETAKEALCREVPLAQDTEESKAATRCLFDILEWRLNGANKKAHHSVWRHKAEDTVCSVNCRQKTE